MTDIRSRNWVVYDVNIVLVYFYTRHIGNKHVSLSRVDSEASREYSTRLKLANLGAPKFRDFNNG